MTKFLTPSDVPEDVVCRTLRIPNSLAWLGIFNKALLATTYYYNWAADVPGSLTREEAAAAALVIVQAAFNSGLECDTCVTPTGERIIRQGEDGTWEMLDNGEWIAPTGDYAIPALEPRTEPTAEERRCLAAANAANVLKQLYEGLADEYAANHDEALFFIAIGTLIATIFLPPLGLLATSFLQIATILVAEGFLAFSFLTADVWDEEFNDKLLCILFDNATSNPDDTVTFNFDGVVNQLTNELAFEIDFTLAQQRLALQMGTILHYIGAEGLNYGGSTTAIADADCNPCLETWCRIQDLESDDGGWVADFGSWSSGVGWTRGCLASIFGVLAMHRYFDDPIIVRGVNVKADIVLGTLAGESVPVNIYLKLEGATVFSASNTAITGENFVSYEGAPLVIDEVYVEFFSSRTDCSGSVESFRAEWFGDGENPFGENNCPE